MYTSNLSVTLAFINLRSYIQGFHGPNFGIFILCICPKFDFSVHKFKIIYLRFVLSDFWDSYVKH
jgi:hypothetical protein